VPFTLPPDTRAVGTGNPPADMNGVVDAITAMGGGFNVTNAAYAGGADPTGVADSTAAISATVTAAAAAGRPVLIPAGTYRVTSTLDWRVAGLQVYGDGKQNTRIIQYTSNTQIVRLAGAHQHISGLQLKYNSQQAAGNTLAIACSFGDDSVGSCFEGIYEDLYIVQAQTGMAVDPSVATVGGAFSCVFRSIRIAQSGGQSAISMFASNGTGANMTGNKWEAVYCSNNFDGSQHTWGGVPVRFQGCDSDHLSVLNIERGNAFNGDVLSFTSCGATVVDDLHIEAVPVSGTPGFGFVFAGSSTVHIRGMSVRSQTLTGVSQNPVVRLGSATSGNRVTVDGYNQPDAAGVSTAHPWADFNSATNSAVIVRNVTATQVTANQVNGAAGDALALGDRVASLDYAPAGAVAEVFPRQHATTAATLTSGTLTVRAVSLPKGLVVSSATFVTNSAVKTGGSHGWYVLLDSARKVVAVTADQTDAATVWGGTNTPYPLAFTAPYIVTAYDGMYYLGVMVAATGMPNFAANPALTGGINGTLTPVLAGTSSTGQTTPPAAGATMTGLTSVAADNLYGYVS